MSEVPGWPDRITEILIPRLSKVMSSFNPYDPPAAKNDDAPEDDPPPAATGIFRAIPIAILSSIWVSYAVAFAVAKWTRPPPEARLMPLLSLQSRHLSWRCRCPCGQSCEIAGGKRG